MISKAILSIATICIILNCSNPENVKPAIPNAILSVQEKADIAKLASHFSSQGIDSIAAFHYSYGMLIPTSIDTNTNFFGTVTFDSAYTDTDIISYQSLTFFNRNWTGYSAESANDTGRVLVANWYSSPQHLAVFKKRVFNIGSTKIITRTDGSLNKPLLIDILRMIAQNKYTNANNSNNPILEQLSSVDSIDLSTRTDSTFINLRFGQSLIKGITTCNFTYSAGGLFLTYISVIVE